MKVQPFSLLSLLLSLGLSAHAQTPSERANARQTFARFRALNQSQKLNTPAARALVVGEAKEYVKGAQRGPMSPPDAFVFPSPTRAVVRVQGLSATGKPITDVYFTLEKVEANWKVSALRSLSLTGMIERARDELKSKTMLSPQERDELANMDLTLALDADLCRHFSSASRLCPAARPKAPSALKLCVGFI